MTGPAFAQFMSSAKTAENASMRLKNIMSGMGTVAAIGLAGAGIALTSFVAHGMSEAGKLQLAMTNLQVATGANAAELKNLQSIAMDVSAHTSQSLTTIVQEAAMMANKGLTKEQVTKLLPQFGAFADVQMRSHGTDPVHAVELAVQASHLLKAYSTKDTSVMLEWLNKLSYTGADLGKTVTQLKYFGPIASTIGIKLPAIMQSLAAMGQTGFLSGRGGTGMQNTILGAIGAAAMTTSRQGKQQAADRGLGLTDQHGRFIFQRSGKMLWPEMLAQLQKVASHTDPIKYTNMLIAAFGRPGGSFVAAMTSKAAAEQMVRTSSKTSHLSSIATMQKQFLSTYDNTVNLLKTNLQTLVAVGFTPLILAVQPAIRHFADLVALFAKWALNNPTAVMRITVGLIATAGTAFAGAMTIGSIKLWQMTAAVIALGKAADIAKKEEAAAAITQVVAGGAGGGGRIGKIISTLLGLDLLKSLFSGIKGLPSWLLGSGFKGAHGGQVVNQRGVLGTAGRVGNTLREALAPMGEALGPLFRGILMSPLNIFKTLMKSGIGGALGDVVAVVLRLGTKFIPIVGWVMLAIDALNLFKAHATDIGWILGTIVRWMRTKLWPGVVSAVTSGMLSVGQAIMNGIKAIMDFVGGLFTGKTEGNILQWFKDVQGGFSNFGAAFNQANGGAIRKPLANGGYEVVMPSPGVRPGVRGATQPHVIKIENVFHITSNDTKAVGRHVTKMFNDSAGRAARAMGGNNASPLLFDSVLQGAH
jgi:hypothetical protein